MATVPLIDYEAASDRVRAVYDDIMAARGTDDVNNFWKALANQPDNLERIWRELKTVMGPGELDPLTKEMVYLAVSVANACDYCTHSHTAGAKAKGMTDGQYAELLAVVGMAHQTNGLATAMKVPIDDAYLA